MTNRIKPCLKIILIAKATVTLYIILRFSSSYRHNSRSAIQYPMPWLHSKGRRLFQNHPIFRNRTNQSYVILGRSNKVGNAKFVLERSGYHQVNETQIAEASFVFVWNYNRTKIKDLKQLMSENMERGTKFSFIPGIEQVFTHRLITKEDGNLF